MNKTHRLWSYEACDVGQKTKLHQTIPEIYPRGNWKEMIIYWVPTVWQVLYIHEFFQQNPLQGNTE